MGRRDLGPDPTIDSGGYLRWWNNAQSSAINVLSLNSSNQLVFNVALATPYPILANNKYLQAANSSGTATNVLELNSSNVISLGPSNLVQLGSGLTFDGTNTLSTYIEPVAMTPVVTGSSGSVSLAYTSSGKWSQVGKLVHFSLTCNVSSVGSATGNFVITLPSPMPASANDSIDRSLATESESITYPTLALQLTAKLLANSNTIQIYGQKTGAASAILAIGTGTLTICGTYSTT